MFPQRGRGDTEQEDAGNFNIMQPLKRQLKLSKLIMLSLEEANGCLLLKGNEFC